MNKTTTAIWAGLVIAAGFFQIQSSIKTEEIHHKLVSAQSELKEETELSHILHTEWTYLNNPERLKKLASNHLGMEPSKPMQVAYISNLTGENSPENINALTTRANFKLPHEKPHGSTYVKIEPKEKIIQIASRNQETIAHELKEPSKEKLVAHQKPTAQLIASRVDETHMTNKQRFEMVLDRIING